MKLFTHLILPSLALGQTASFFGKSRTKADTLRLLMNSIGNEYQSYEDLKNQDKDLKMQEMVLKEQVESFGKIGKEERLRRLKKMITTLESESENLDVVKVSTKRIEQLNSIARRNLKIVDRLHMKDVVVKEGTALHSLLLRTINALSSIIVKNSVVRALLEQELMDSNSVVVKAFGSERSKELLALLKELNFAAGTVKAGTSHLIKRSYNSIVDFIAGYWIVFCVVMIIITAPTVIGPAIWTALLVFWILVLIFN